MASSFVGRQADLERLLAELVASAGLWTITGPPGIGKTRASRELQARWDGEATFVDASTARDDDGLVQLVLRALDLKLPDDAARAERVARVGAHLARMGASLVVLDDVDGAVASARMLVQTWAASAPEIRWVVTSRVVLGGALERIVELGPLAEAEELFVDRVRRIRADYDESDPAERNAVRELVDALDRIPLAIELAAARMRVMSASELAERARERLAVLTGGRQRFEHRWDTLGAAIEASWVALAPWERDAFAQCAVFAGSFAASAAEAVLDLSPYPDAPPAIDVLAALRDKSLLSPGSPSGLRMLLTLREYAHAKLVETGSLEATEARHARHVLGASRSAADDLDLGRGRPLGIVLAEREQLEAIAERALRAGARREALRHGLEACIVLATLVETQGVDVRHARWLEQVVERCEEEDAGESALVPEGLLALSATKRAMGDLAASRALAERTVELADRLGHDVLRGRAQRRLGMLAIDQGRLDEALVHLETACEIHRAGGHEVHLAIASSSLGRALYAAGDSAGAERRCLDALERHKRLGTEIWEALTRGYLAYIAMDSGRLSDAETLLATCIAQLERLGSDVYVGAFSGALASLHHTRGELALARTRFERAWQSMDRSGRRRLAGIHGGNVGLVSFEQNDIDTAIEWLGRAREELETIGDVSSSAMFGACLAAASARLGRIHEAEHLLDRARANLARTTPAARRVIDVMGAGVTLGRALHTSPVDAPRAIAEVEATLEDARKSGPERLPSDVQIALRIVEAELARVRREPRLAARAVVRVHVDGEWLERDGERVSFGSRPVLARMLAALIARWIDERGALLRPAALVGATWPGERMRPEAATARLHATVARLRREGLAGILENVDGGYRLSPDAPVEVVGRDRNA